MSALTDGRARRAKHPGTGILDTPLEAWAALYRDYMAGTEPLTDVVRRHGMRYSAARETANREFWPELRELLRGGRRGFLYSLQYDRAHAWCERGHTYLADALAKVDSRPEPWISREPTPAAVDVSAPVVDLAAFRAARRGDPT